MLSPPYGLVSLFGLSLLASTLVPLGSEWLLILLIVEGYPAPTTVAVATLGNSLGAVTTYLIGIFGSDVLTRRVLRLSAHDLHRAGTMYRRFGVWSLLLSWVPIVGDPLCLVAGALRTPLPLFLVLVPLGKVCRYSALAFLTLQGLR
ncbi:DedA family protein [Desulfoprunum benzoelyticum]|nr:DedA family protein [Desulfoprunum benzoelyticum]